MFPLRSLVRTHRVVWDNADCVELCCRVTNSITACRVVGGTPILKGDLTVPCKWVPPGMGRGIARKGHPGFRGEAAPDDGSESDGNGERVEVGCSGRDIIRDL